MELSTARLTGGGTFTVWDYTKEGWSSPGVALGLEAGRTVSDAEYLGLAPTLVIQNNLTVDSSEYWFGDKDNVRGFRQIKVGGDVLLKGVDAGGMGIHSPSLRTVFLPDVNGSATYSRTNLSMDVSGVVDFQFAGNWDINRSGEGASARTDGVNAFVRVGGLKGVGVNTFTTSHSDAASTSLIFENPDGNFRGGDITVKFFHEWECHDTGHRFNIIMNDTVGKNAQILRITDNSGTWHKSILSATVESGRLGVYTNSANSVKLSSLTLQGGVFSVENSSADFAGIDGIVEAGAMDWTGGKVLIDFAKTGDAYQNDVLIVDSLTGGNYVFEFDLNGLDFDDQGIFGLEFFRITGDASGLDGDSFKGYATVGGVTYEAVFAFANGSLSIAEFVVPEPAAFAAVLGAFAIISAFLRKRRRIV